MSIAVKVITDTPVYMSFDRVTIMELIPGEVYEIPDEMFNDKKFHKLSDAELAALVKAASKEDAKELKEDVKAAEEDALVVDASAEGGLTLNEDVAHANDAAPVRREQPEPTPADDSVQSATVQPQNKTVRKFQSKSEDK